MTFVQRLIGFGVMLSMGAAAWAESLPRPELSFKGAVGRTVADSDRAQFPQPVQPSQDAPNVVVILLDDVGFGQFSAFGGEVPSPAMERLAEQGLSYNRFHTSGICSPTRAALLTGRNPHNVGFGHVGEMATGYDGYTGLMPRSAATIAEVLRQNGYATAMFGKNHNTPSWERGPSGPFDRWPTGMGFDYFYGFHGWGTSQWSPLLFENTLPVPPSSDPDYHLTPDLVDRAIGWTRHIKTATPDKPFFLYFATGATHAPHHAPEDWIDRFKGQFDDGWDRYRERVFARQKQMGVVPESAQLSVRPDAVPAWDSLPAEQRQILARQMEVFAGFGAHTDHHIGRLLDAVRTLPDGDNTLVFYIVGDNGASAEGGLKGKRNEFSSANHLPDGVFPPEVLAGLGKAKYNNNFSYGWAWAMSTPFPYFKQVVSHLGAIRNPLIVSWPRRIKQSGVRFQFHHVIDVAPTILEAAALEAPGSVNGVAQQRVDGISMLESFASPERKGRSLQYFEVFGNRGIYHDGWFASARLADPWNSDRGHLDPDRVQWELYDLREDFSQAVDLSSKHSEKLRELQDLWWAEAGRNNVLPLDWRARERFIEADALQPKPARGRHHFLYYPGTRGLPEGIAPVTRNRSFHLTAKGELRRDDEGVLITQGGYTGGWALYVQDGRLVFDYNYGQFDEYRIMSEPLPETVTTLQARIQYDGVPSKDFGAGATVSLWASGKRIGEGRLEQTLRGIYTVSEGLDVGADFGSPVSEHYRPPFFFSGLLESVSVDLDPR